MLPQVENKILSNLDKSIIQILLYYQVFKYPLNLEEICLNCGLKNYYKQTISRALNYLVKKGFLYQFGDFFLCQNQREWVERRIIGNQEAAKYMKKARFFSAVIASFPFVRAVFLSGSISKNYMDKNSDIDYFIIIEPKRLWITRTLLVFFRKIFMKKLNKYLCMNYFIDSEHLEIEDKNIYTAIETLSLIPTYGKETCQNFMNHNLWAKKYFPNYNRVDSLLKTVHSKSGIVKYFLEKLLNNSLGNKLDCFLMRICQKRWHRHYPILYNNSVKSIYFDRHIAKAHLNDYSMGIIETYQSLIKDYENKWKMIL